MISVRVVDLCVSGWRGGVQPSPFLLRPALLQVVLQALGHEGCGLHQELFLRLSWMLHPCTIGIEMACTTASSHLWVATQPTPST